MTIPVSDLQELNNISIIEMYSLELQPNLHYVPADINMSYTQDDNDIIITTTDSGSVPSVGDLVNLEFNELLENGSEAVNMIDTFYTVFHVSGNTFKGKSLTNQDISANQPNRVTFKKSSTNVPITFLFYSGVNLKDSQSIVWQGNTYDKFPCSAEGYTYSTNGALPRPKIAFSNIFGNITSFLDTYNIFNVGGFSCPINLGGAKLIRHRTLAKHLDNINFLNNVNPYNDNDPDPSAEFDKEIYFVERLISEDREIASFELISTFDLIGVNAPSKLATVHDFPGIGKFINQ